MAVVDDTVNESSEALAAIPALEYFREKIVDFSVAANNLATSDTMILFDLPVGILMQGCKVDVLTAEGSAMTMDLGVTGGDVDKYIDGADGNAVGITLSGDAGTAEPVAYENNGSYIATAESISLLTLTAGLSTAVVRFQIWGVDLRSRLADPA